MQSELLNDLLQTVDSKMFTLVLQLIIVGAVVMWIKDVNGRIVNYLKLRLSDFGRGTKVIIDGHKGFINNVRFDEVEIDLEENGTLLVPVEKFINSNKIIITREGGKK